MTTAARRRPARPVDVTAFAEQVAVALAAFGQDVSYAVHMARAAVVIANKRAVWAARAELRTAETRAHTLCANTDAFECHATCACGTGDCKFAAGEYATLTVAASCGDHHRPQHNSTGSYSMDEAVNALARHRRSPHGGTAAPGRTP